MEEVITVVLVGDGNMLLEVPRSNGLDQPILRFCHSIPNFGSTPESLESILTVQTCRSIRRVGYLPLKQTENKIRNKHKHGRRGNEEKRRKTKYLV